MMRLDYEGYIQCFLFLYITFRCCCKCKFSLEKSQVTLLLEIFYSESKQVVPARIEVLGSGG